MVRASVLGRLPCGPCNRLWVLGPRTRDGAWLGLTWDQYQLLRRWLAPSPLAAFRYEHQLLDGPRGQTPLTVVAMSTNLPGLLGATAPLPLLAPTFAPPNRRIVLDNRAASVGGFVPASNALVFRHSQVWVRARPGANPQARYFVVGPTPLAGLGVEPLPRYVLDNLSLARLSWAGVLGLWLLLAAYDLAQLARRQGLRRLHHAAAVVLSLLAYLLLSLAGLRWCLEDQRYRCRTCLRRLRMPLNQGTLGGILLAAPATEYLCPRSHGKLLVPARPWQPHPQQVWRFALDWWQELTLAPRR